MLWWRPESLPRRRRDRASGAGRSGPRGAVYSVADAAAPRVRGAGHRGGPSGSGDRRASVCRRVCDRVAVHQGMCNRHYQRWVADGRPEAEAWATSVTANARWLQEPRTVHGRLLPPGAARARAVSFPCRPLGRRLPARPRRVDRSWRRRRAVTGVAGVCVADLHLGCRRRRRALRSASQPMDPSRPSTGRAVDRAVPVLGAGQVRPARAADADAVGDRLRDPAARR